jgi:hypothetical protein
MIYPSDLLTFAEALAQSTTEVEWRGAISRAYYGAFHGGCQLAQITAAIRDYERYVLRSVT